MSSKSLVFHTSRCISSSPSAFLLLISFSTERSSYYVNCPNLMSYLLLIIFLIASCVTFGCLPSKFSKYFSTGAFVLPGSFQFRFHSVLPFAHFVYRLPCYPRLSIFNRVSNFFYLILYLNSLFLYIYFS